MVCDYGQILKPETLAIARLGGINLHASLLPKYRGAAPINWAVYHGERETGNTVIHMSPAVDAGPAIAQVGLPIGPDETAADLEPRLAELGAPLVADAIEELIAGTAQPIAQDPAQATRAPRLKKTDGLVDWSRPAAGDPQPGPRPRPLAQDVYLLAATGRRAAATDLGKGPRCRRQVAKPGGAGSSGDRLVIATGEQALLARSRSAGRQHAAARRIPPRLSGPRRRAIRLSRFGNWKRHLAAFQAVGRRR